MSRVQSSDLPSVNGLPAKNKKSSCVQMGGLCWLHDLVISVIPWVRGQVSVPAIREMGCSVRGTDQLLAASHVGCSLVEMSQGNHSAQELVCTLYPKQGQLALVPVCTGSCQSHRTVPRL